MRLPTELAVAAGLPVVIRRASGESGEALEREEARLRLARHPGVVEVVHAERDGEAFELHLLRSGAPLASMPAMPPAQVASTAAAVAETVADLHAEGIIHGHLDASCVLVGGGGRVVISGLGADADGATTADDVASIGELVRWLLACGDGSRGRRWPLDRQAAVRRSLLTLADEAAAEPADRRPSARRLVVRLAQLVDAPRQPTTSHRPRHAAPRRRSQLPALFAASGGTIALALTAVRLGNDGGSPPEQAGATTSSVSAPVTDCVRLAAGAGCAVDVDVDGTTIVVDDRVYEVGAPGDRVVLGDWDCDGGATPAVLRPKTGEVFVFAAWADADGIEVPVAAQIEGAQALVTEPGRQPGCLDLLVRLADGSTAPVHLTPGGMR